MMNVQPAVSKVCFLCFGDHVRSQKKKDIACLLVQSNLNLHDVYGVCSFFFHGHASIGMLSHAIALHD